MCLPGAGGGFIEGSLKPEGSGAMWDAELKYIGGNRSLVDGLADECRRASVGWPWCVDWRSIPRWSIYSNRRLFEASSDSDEKYRSNVGGLCSSLMFSNGLC